METSRIDLLLWHFTFWSQVLLLFVLLLRRRVIAFPVFSALILFNVCRTMVLYPVRVYAGAYYFDTYWTFGLIDMGLQIVLLYELSAKVFRPLGSWATDVRRGMLIWSIASVGVAGGLTLLPKPGPDAVIQEIVVQKVSFASAALMSELFVGLIVLSIKAGLSWSSHVTKIASGFVTYSLTTLILETVNTYLGLGESGPLYTGLSEIRIAVYFCCVLGWIVTLWFDAPPIRRLPYDVRLQVKTINEALGDRLQNFRTFGDS